MMRFSNIVSNIDIHICTADYSAPHSHDFLELAYVLSGKAAHTLNGQEVSVQKGDFLILDYNAVHSYHQIGDEPLAIINCLFEPEFIDRSLKGCRTFSDVVNNYMIKYSCTTINISPANFIFTDCDQNILHLLEDMLHEYKTKQSGLFEIMRCKLIEIIILTMRKHTLQQPACADELCERMIQYAEKNMTEKNILSSLSADLNFSVSYLSRKFKECMGISFSGYIKKLRIEYCCRLLANTDKKIIEIAQAVGYSDMKFFNRIFKEQLGITPREFRKRF